MNESPCCHDRLRASRSDSSGTPARRVARLTSFFLSGATLLLMPKCPLCLAVQVTLLTGISVSTAMASHLRMALIIVCLGVPVFLALTWLGRIYRWRRKS